MRLAGLARGRSLPAIPPKSFRSTDRHPAPATTAAANEVVLWPDTFTDHLDPAVARAAVKVLEAAGRTVTVPRGTVCCGLTWISTGQLDHARKVLRRTVDNIAESAAPIVVLEPSCAASLREELPQLLADDPRAVRIAERVVSLAQILREAELFDLTGTEINLQPHCHQRSGWGFGDDLALLAASGATVTKTIDGCCGLAGNFGMERGHEEVSAKVAALHLLPALAAAAPGTAVVADGYSCRTQVHDLAPEHRPMHLAELLARGL
jgi:Fe-S oxidoreductase